ncbi:OprD family outer membrane porin [Pseudomonas baltica]|uniref:OprD family outer membrane porin n=1 Tax=Pseudomonas baltica TaxID=2762576 RepID=UPI002899F510|nr:OprD family outer membrane porin [Pseudomonas baltica]
MRKSSLALAIAVGALAQQASAAGFLEDSHASVSSRTFFFQNDNREAAPGSNADQRELATILRADFISGYTQGTVGFGLDLVGFQAFYLGGDNKHTANNSFFPGKAQDADDAFSGAGGNVKAKISKTELKLGNALAPNLPILVANDGRVAPQFFQGGSITSKDIDNLTLTAGQLEQQRGRASSNWTGMSVNGAIKDSNKFIYAGGDWKATKDLTLQYYFANLEDFYKQNFLGLLHVWQIDKDQSFKTDLRWFNTTSDGANADHQAGYGFNGNGSGNTGAATARGWRRADGEIDNTMGIAMFTYTLGGHSLMVGHQRISDSGGFVYMNSGSMREGTNAATGNGGVSFYSFTDSLISGFNKAGENTTFGQYSYDFARLGVPGLKASAAYLSGVNVRPYGNQDGRGTEHETDLRVDYVIQSGALKGFGTTLRQGIYNGNVGTAKTNQTRLIFNYTYNFF